MLHFFIQAWKSVIFVCLQIKYLWTEIRNLDGILDGIPDFGRTENDILDSMFVQSLFISLSVFVVFTVTVLKFAR